MMNDIRKKLVEYQKNAEWIDHVEDRCRVEKPLKQWVSGLRDEIRYYHTIYEQNTIYFGEIMKVLSVELNEETASELFDLTKEFYQNVDDGGITLPIFQKLLKFYQEKNDYDKVIIISTYIDYIVNAINALSFGYEQRIMDFVVEHIKNPERFFELKTEEGKYRFLVCYFDTIIPGADYHVISIDEAFQYYHEMMDFLTSDQFDGREEEKEMISDFLSMFHSRMIGLEAYISDALPENQKEFCEITDKICKAELEKDPDPKNLDVLIYAAYLRVQILRGEKTLSENFDALFYYFKDSFENIEDTIETSEKEIFHAVRTCTTIIRWMKQGISKEQSNKIIGDILTMIETKWKKLKNIRSKTIDDLVYGLVAITFDMPLEASEKERYAFEFGIRRQVPTFVNAVTVKNIATPFLSVLLEKKPYLFDSLSYMSESELYSFVENCAIFHNLGNITMPVIRKHAYRRFTDEELARLKDHTTIGANMVKNVSELQKLHDVMLYHHKFYNGQGGFPEDVNNLDSPYKAVTDLISLVDFIDEFTDPLLCEPYVSSSFDDCLEAIKKGRGTQFHPEMVDVLLESYELQDKIKYAISESRIQLAFSLYHSFDIGASEEENEEYLEETLNLIIHASTERDIQKIERRMEHLFMIAENSHSTNYLGKAYYVSVRYYELKKDSIRIVNHAMHSIRFLSENREYTLIAKLYNILGVQATFNGEYGNAVNNFLLCADYAKKANENYGIGVAYNNISNIFLQIKNYIKALEYMERSEPFFASNVYNQSAIMCYKMFYYCKLGEIALAKEIKNDLDLYLEENEGYSQFVVDLFYGCFYYYTKDQEKALYYLKCASKAKEIKEGLQENWSEFDIYYDMLNENHLYEDLHKALDYQINLIEKNIVPTHLSTSLLRRAISCAKAMKRPELVTYYGEKLDMVFQAEDRKKIDMILEAEYSALDNIAFQEKHEELLNDNYKLKEGLKLAEHANEAKNTFLTSMSHEIRTPINAVLGLDEIILRESNEENIKQYAADIQTAGKTLLGIINDILDFSKLEAGKMELVPEEYLLKAMTRELDQMIASRAEQKHLQFHVKVNSSIPCKLYGDDLRIKQVIMNLLTNAVKYTEKGSVTFSIDYEKKSEDSILLKVLVEDTGIGLKPEEMEKLAKPFERLDVKRNRTIEGTGLGISIVTNLLKQMGSRLRVHSTYGVGSSFSFELEQKVIDWTSIGEMNDKSGLVIPKKKGPLFVASDVKVLVVDDTAVNLAVVKGLLKRNKVNLTLVKSGMECLEACAKETFHLILLDHRMPEMDGVETLHRLKQEKGFNQNTPVIALTANAIAGAYEYYKNEGFDDLVIKPVQGQELEEKMLQFLPKELVTLP